MEVSPFGIHWPDLDEDLSFAGLSRGDYGQYVDSASPYPDAIPAPLSVAEGGNRGKGDR